MRMPSRHHHDAIGLQTDCMMVVPPPVVRLPDSHVYMPYGPRLRVDMKAKFAQLTWVA